MRREEGRGGLPGSTADLGEGELDTPNLTLVSQAILADELQFTVPGGPKRLVDDHNRRERSQAPAQWPVMRRGRRRGKLE